MKYQYTYKTTAKELWQLSMYHIYGSMVGVCNILFTAGVIAVMVTGWSTAPLWQRIALIVCLFLFPVIQPLAVYGRARRQAQAITQELTLGADDGGLHISIGKEHSDIPWKQIGRISRKPGMIVLFADRTHGFILTSRVLGAEKEEFYQYVVSKVGR